MCVVFRAICESIALFYFSLIMEVVVEWRLFFGNERKISGGSCRVQTGPIKTKPKNPIIKIMCKLHKTKTFLCANFTNRKKSQKTP